MRDILKWTRLMAIYLFLALLLMVVLTPFYWLFVSGLKTRTELFSYPPTLLPREWAFGNFVRALSDPILTRSFFNSVVVSLSTVVGGVLLCSMAGYAFAKFRFRFRSTLFIAVLVAMMIPFHIVVIPLYLQIRSFGLLDSLFGVILPFLARPFGIFFMRQYLTRLPDELLEAARIDGASEWFIWRRIVLPISRPACGVLACLFFVETWNMLLWPMIVLQSESRQTVQVYLQSLIGVYHIDFGVLYAGAVLAVLPILILFALMQRQIISGLTAGAVKQ